MVAVYCLQEDASAQVLRDVLLAAGIPCALVGPTHGPASIAYKVPFVLFTPAAETYGEGLRRKLPLERILAFSEMEPAEQAPFALETAYLRRFGADYAISQAAGIRFEAERAYFRGHYLPLTSTEYRILRLLFHSRGTYFAAEEIAAACLADPAGGVAVHICNINNKARRTSLHAVIESRRFSGYRVP